MSGQVTNRFPSRAAIFVATWIHGISIAAIGGCIGGAQSELYIGAVTWHTGNIFCNGQECQTVACANKTKPRFCHLVFP